MTIDLQGQGQGQIREKQVFRPKSRYVSRKMYLLLQFSIDGVDISHNHSRLVWQQKYVGDFGSDA